MPFCYQGTGKTVVGTHIVYWFHQLNKEAEGKAPTQEGKKQILYCGPSNKSVDVVAGNYCNKYTFNYP